MIIIITGLSLHHRTVAELSTLLLVSYHANCFDRFVDFIIIIIIIITSLTDEAFSLNETARPRYKNRQNLRVAITRLNQYDKSAGDLA